MTRSEVLRQVGQSYNALVGVMIVVGMAGNSLIVNEGWHWLYCLMAVCLPASLIFLLSFVKRESLGSGGYCLLLAIQVMLTSWAVTMLINFLFLQFV